MKYIIHVDKNIPTGHWIGAIMYTVVLTL